MKLFLSSLILLPFLTTNALSENHGTGANSLHGCFHNGVLYSTTQLNNTCPSLSPHTHVKNLHTFHYNATGTVPLVPFQSKHLNSYMVTPAPPSKTVRGDPDCILNKMPIGQ